MMIEHNSTYEIHPYQGMNNLQFGLDVESVIALLGSPDLRKQNEFGLMISYPDFNLMFSRNGTLEEIGFKVHRARVSINGIMLEDGSRELKPHLLLQKLDPDPVKTDGGALLFMKLGVSVFGYHDSREADAITCFRRGVWDEFI